MNSKNETPIGIKLFDKDCTALFDNDQQYDHAILSIFRQMEEAQKKNPMEDVIAIWKEVAKTEAEIRALTKTKQQSENQKCQKLIDEERKKLALAVAEVKSITEEKQQLANALAKKRRMMHKLIDQQVVKVPEMVADNMEEILRETRQEVVAIEKKKIKVKQSLLELVDWNDRRSDRGANE